MYPITLFENEDFSLNLTGHDFDFVGFIESKKATPLTFFFREVLVPYCGGEDDYEPDEDKTELIGVYEGLSTHNEDDDTDAAEEIACDIEASCWFTLEEGQWAGFLSDCKQRGWFLALVKNYCPERLKDIPWA